ncbi:MAG: DUF1573 domain-containing protein [Planctomycetes bacterium]|nr:DUF1573 domain-containing protein [Planctomycetota bacterium]
MPRLLALLCVAVLAAAEVENANAVSPEFAPTVRESQPFQARVTVRNTHKRAVRISRLDTTCHCSKLELGSRFLIPGETTTLDVVAASDRRSGPQKVRVSLFVSDPDLEPIEVWCWWNVREMVAVDAIPPGAQPDERPADTAWRDVYRFVAHERPDEPQRLRKRVRLSCPPEETPPGGLRVEGIDYPGTLWAFASRTLDNGAIVITATARDQQGPLPTGEFGETVVIRTNHPGKPRIELRFETQIDLQAGRDPRDPMGQ